MTGTVLAGFLPCSCFLDNSESVEQLRALWKPLAPWFHWKAQILLVLYFNQYVHAGVFALCYAMTYKSLWSDLFWY